MKHGFVYIAHCEALDYFKIGITSCVEARMKALRAEWRAPVFLVDSFPSDIRVEKALHERLSHHRLKGEWYRRRSEVLQAFAFAKRGRLEDMPDTRPVKRVPHPQGSMV